MVWFIILKKMSPSNKSFELTLEFPMPDGIIINDTQNYFCPSGNLQMFAYYMKKGQYDPSKVTLRKISFNLKYITGKKRLFAAH